MEHLLPAPTGVVVDTTPQLPSGVSPAAELGTLVGWAAAIFYLAESDVNPGVTSYWDALHYIATSLSVGYANIFPVTPLGKTVGSVVMMLGPALSGRVLDAPREQEPAAVPPLDLSPVVERLDAILQQLHGRNPGSSAARGADGNPP